MKKIIVPVDFSCAAGAALRFAKHLSEITQLDVLAIYVHNSMIVSNRPGTAAERKVERSAMRKQLRDFVAKHVRMNEGTPRVDSLVAEGIPPVYIKWRSLQEDAAMIVMAGVGAAVGFGGRQDLLGHIATTVAGEGGCPVVLIPKHYGERQMQETAMVFRGLGRGGKLMRTQATSTREA